MSNFLSFIFASGSPIGRIIVKIIFILFVIGLFDFLIHCLYRIRRERSALQKAKDHIKQPMSTESLEHLEEGLREAGVWTKSLTYQRIQQLVQIKANHGKFDSDSLSEIALGRQSLWGGLGRHLTSILVLVGLFGTVWGLSKAIVEVQPLITDIEQLGDLTRVSSIIGETLSGMKTAFSTTLAGLLGSLLLGLIGLWVNRVGARFSIELEEFTMTTLLPIFNPSSAHQLQRTTEHLTKTAAAMESAMEKGTRAMQQSARQLADSPWETPLAQQYQLIEKFGEFSEEFKQSFGKINEFQHTIDSALDSFRSAVSELSNKQGQLMEILQSSLPSLKQESESIKEMIDDYQSSQSDFITDLHNVFRTSQEHLLNQFTSRLQESNEMIEELSKQQQSVSDRLRNLVETIHESVDTSNKQLSESFNESMEDMRLAISQFIVQQQQITTRLEKLGAELQIKDAFEQQNNLLRDLTRPFDEFEHITAEIQNFQHESQQGVQELTAQQQQTTTAIETLVNELQIEEMLEQQKKQLHDLLNSFDDFEHITAEIQGLRQESLQQGNELISITKKNTARTTEINLLRRLSASMENLAESVTSRGTVTQNIRRFFSFGKSSEEKNAEEREE